MLTKKFTPKRTICKVNFSVPAELAQESVAVAGDFNDWTPEVLALDEKKGEFAVELRLKPESEYNFKYLIDGETWENDHKADAYVPNEFGTDNSVVVIGK